MLKKTSAIKGLLCFIAQVCYQTPERQESNTQQHLMDNCV